MIYQRFLFVLIFLFSLFLFTSFASHLSAETRGISVVAKSAKGKTHSIEIYDYTAALIIGIDRYENLGPGHQLSYAVKDARGMEKSLRENYQFNEIVTLYNEDATRASIMKAIYSFQELSPDASLFVYYAGHGITMPGIGGKDLGYLIPYDGALNRVEMHKNISMQQIKADISPLIGAKHIFFVFDACFAGLMLDTRATLSAPKRDISYLQAITGEQVRQVLTAGSRGQTVLDGGPGGHSVFTGRFIEILEGVEDYITAREVGQLLKKRVYGDAAARGHTQRPVDGEIYGTGDFVFIPDLGKKNRDLKAEVNALEAEMVRLKRLEKEAVQAKDQMLQQRLERERLKKDAELKLARIKQREKEAALKRQQQAARDADAQAKARVEQEHEHEKRLAMLRKQAEQRRTALGKDLTGGATIESAVAELKRIKKERDEIAGNFEVELRKQKSDLIAFYDKKIARLADISPWDREFETKADYGARLREAEQKAAPTRREKKQKLTGIRQELTQTRDSQINPLNKQIKTLENKRFTIPSSEVSFKFTSYKIEGQEMFGELTVAGIKTGFYCLIPKKKAREYKHNPDLLVPEVKMQATVNGGRLYRIIFYGPGKGEEYIGKPDTDVLFDFSFIDNGNDTVSDTRTGLMWASKDNGKNINWANARTYCNNYTGGGHRDWRLPTQNELAGIYDKQQEKEYKSPNFITLTGCCPWASETRGSEAADFSFVNGLRSWFYQSDGYRARALPVRSGK
jgi:hypothetical protein